MSDQVEHLKNTKHQSPDETVEEIIQFCEENKIDIPTLLKTLVRSCRQRCINNFIDDADYGYCTDTEGERVAYGLDTIAEAYGFDRNHIKCSEVNSKGCCAKINKILYDLSYGLFEFVEESKNEARG